MMKEEFKLVDSGWNNLFEKTLNQEHCSLHIISPFIKKSVVERILKLAKTDNIKIITRFNLADFYDGVSDISALRLLLQYNSQIHGVRNLHAKVYLFGDRRVIITSANLTEAALHRNHEFGLVAEQPKIIEYCTQYFNDLWDRSGSNLTLPLLEKWEKNLEKALVSSPNGLRRAGLSDEGTDLGKAAPPLILSSWIAEAPQAFIKFFGLSSKRADPSRTVIEELKRAGCHWACTYPRGKRPRQVQDGAVIFMGLIVKGSPNDIRIYGRAIAMSYKEVRDDATPADISTRKWKEKWPHYIRVHHPEFVAGTIANGVSLNELMEELQENAFASTQRNATKGHGNINPRKAYMRQPAVELSVLGFQKLTEKLEKAFALNRRLTLTELEQLDWPA